MFVLVSRNPCLFFGVYNSPVSLKLLYKSTFFVIAFNFFDAESEQSSAAPANIGLGLESVFLETAGSASDADEIFDNDIVLD